LINLKIFGATFRIGVAIAPSDPPLATRLAAIQIFIKLSEKKSLTTGKTLLA